MKKCRKDEIRKELKKTGQNFKSDLTCCVHAEQRAMIMALMQCPCGEDASEILDGSIIHFIRINDNGDAIPSGKPYCTICSKLALDCGVYGWILWHDDGVWDEGKGLYLYTSDEYNELSFQHRTD